MKSPMTEPTAVTTTSDRLTRPTMARLSIWVSPERMPEVEAAYEDKLMPVLKRHALVESDERCRHTGEGVFSRLLEAESPTELIASQAVKGCISTCNALQPLGNLFY